LQAKDNKQGSAGVVTDWPEGFIDCDNDPTFGDHRIDGFGEKQTAAEYLSAREAHAQGVAREVYEERLAFGVAKEQARKDLPLSTYTEAIWKCDLHNLFHFLGLRLDPHAQAEIRAFANAIAEIVKVWVPWAWEAFEDYRLHAMYLSRQEIQGLRALLAPVPVVPDPLDAALKGSGLKGREKKEFITKLGRLLATSE